VNGYWNGSTINVIPDESPGSGQGNWFVAGAQSGWSGNNPTVNPPPLCTAVFVNPGGGAAGYVEIQYAGTAPHRAAAPVTTVPPTAVPYYDSPLILDTLFSDWLAAEESLSATLAAWELRQMQALPG